MARSNGKAGAARRSWLILGGAAFILMVATLLPAHRLHDHACNIDTDTDCYICLHLDGNPVDPVTPYTPQPPMIAGCVAPAPTFPWVSSMPLVPHGRAPPVVDPVT